MAYRYTSEQLRKVYEEMPAAKLGKIVKEFVLEPRCDYRGSYKWLVIWSNEVQAYVTQDACGDTNVSNRAYLTGHNSANIYAWIYLNYDNVKKWITRTAKKKGLIR